MLIKNRRNDFFTLPPMILLNSDLFVSFLITPRNVNLNCDNQEVDAHRSLHESNCDTSNHYFGLKVFNHISLTHIHHIYNIDHHLNHHIRHKLVAVVGPNMDISA